MGHSEGRDIENRNNRGDEITKKENSEKDRKTEKFGKVRVAHVRPLNQPETKACASRYI